MERLGVVLRHALAVIVHDAEIVHRRGHALLGGLAEPKERLGVVLRHAPAFVVHDAEVEHRHRVPRLGGLAAGLHSLRVALCREQQAA